MEDTLFIDSVRRHCLLSPSVGDRLIARHCCNCTNPVITAHRTHLLDCPRNQWYYDRRHNTACCLLASAVRALHPRAFVQREVVAAARPRSARHSERPGDLCITMPEGTQCTVDVSSAIPLATLC